MVVIMKPQIMKKKKMGELVSEIPLTMKLKNNRIVTAMVSLMMMMYVLTKTQVVMMQMLMVV